FKVSPMFFWDTFPDWQSVKNADCREPKMSTEAFIDYSGLPLWLLAVLAIVGIAFLWQGGDFLTNGASALGVRLKIDPIIVGLTVVSIATSLPELLTSLLAAMKGSPDVATGNIIGSNIANIALILGVAG